MISAFKEMGINTESDLTTSDMLSNYRYSLLKQKDIFKTKEYILKVSSAATASKVFVQLEDLGISNASIDRVNDIDLEIIKNICRVKSMENAKAKAVALTKSLGQSVGAAILISDKESGFDNQLQGKVSGIVVTAYGTNKLKEEKYEAPKIEFEKIKVHTSVDVKFVLK